MQWQMNLITLHQCHACGQHFYSFSTGFEVVIQLVVLVHFKLGPNISMSSAILKPLWVRICDDAVHLVTSHQAESPEAETSESGIH